MWKIGILLTYSNMDNRDQTSSSHTQPLLKIYFPHDKVFHSLFHLDFDHMCGHPDVKNQTTHLPTKRHFSQSVLDLLTITFITILLQSMMQCSAPEPESTWLFWKEYLISRSSSFLPRWVSFTCSSEPVELSICFKRKRAIFLKSNNQQYVEMEITPLF